MRLPPAGTTWRNWSGAARCTPARMVRPRDEDDIIAAVRLAGDQGLTVRAAGTGHSFNSIACTDGVLIDMPSYSGVLAVNSAQRTVTVRAGTAFTELCRVLDQSGLALDNLGTLAEQTVGGAVITGNHGTGLNHPQLGGLVTGFRMVAADGTVRECAAGLEEELLRCGRTSLGSLGVITEVTLRCVPSFNLRVTEGSELAAALFERFDEWTRSGEHVSFSLKAWSDRAATRSLDLTDESVSPDAPRRRRANSVGEVTASLVGQAGRVSRAAVPPLTRLLAGSGSEAGPYVDRSHRAFTFRQPVKFLSMEHALPLANVVPALAALRGVLGRFGLYSPYSVTTRIGAGDDAPLSPAYGRPTGYLNLTVPRTVGYAEILRIAEAVFDEHEGRPHWGKAHTATAARLAPRYPEWDVFQRLRAELDPAGLYTSDYIRRIIGAVAPH